MLNEPSPYTEIFAVSKSTQTQRCLGCNDSDIKKLDIRKACCSWTENEVNCKAIFGREGYYKGTGIRCLPIAWHSYLEKELVNFDGTFKGIISYLTNASRDSDFKLAPDLYRSEDDRFKTYYPLFKEIANKEIPKFNTVEIVSFLGFEGAIRKDGLAFDFCPTCGTKNELDFRMEETECSSCGYRDNPECDENCPEYDAESGECTTCGFPKICCFILPNGDCLGPRLLEVKCRNCGDEYADSVVSFDPHDKRKIDAILNPEDCNCLGVRYKLVNDVLEKLNKGFTFREMISETIKTQGWKTTSGRKSGESGTCHDVDILCEKDNKSILVECKRLISKKGIDLNVVLNLFARMTDLGINRGLIVTTTQRVSLEALSFARYYGIRILNVQQILTERLDNIFENGR